MEPFYDLHSWSKQYREDARREVGERHLHKQAMANGQPISVRITFRIVTAAALMAAVALLLSLATVKPAEAAIVGFPEGHHPRAFENDGDIKVARIVYLANLGPSIVHLENLTPNTAHSNDVDPAVSPDGKYVAFSSDRDGDDFEIYVANFFTGEVEQVTDNTVYDYNPGWSFDGERITYIEPLLSPEDVRIFGLRFTHEAPLPSRE